jgi:hypothetical protein
MLNVVLFVAETFRVEGIDVDGGKDLDAVD